MTEEELKGIIRFLRSRDCSYANFSAAGCSFQIPKSTAIDLCRKQLSVIEALDEESIEVLPAFRATAYTECVYIEAGSENC